MNGKRSKLRKVVLIVGGEQVGPLVALILHSRRTLAARPPTVTEPAFLADAPVRRENTPLESFLFRLTP